VSVLGDLGDAAIEIEDLHVVHVVRGDRCNRGPSVIAQPRPTSPTLDRKILRVGSTGSNTRAPSKSA
jgi:hypothetical protein